VLTDNQAQTKMSLAAPALFPALAFLDAKYTYELSASVTINTVVDALSHSVEGMLSKRSGIVANGLAEKSIRLITSCFEPLKNNALGSGERKKLLLASTLGGMVIANTGTCAVHAMGYPLTYFKEIEHGRANGYLLGAYLEFSESVIPERVHEILSCMNVSSVSDFKKLLRGLLGKPAPLTPVEVELFTEKACWSPNIINGYAAPDKEQVKAMFDAAFSA
jgi:alcohol dehydrogenase class IV